MQCEIAWLDRWCIPLTAKSGSRLDPLVGAQIGGGKKRGREAGAVPNAIVLRVVDEIELVDGEVHELRQTSWSRKQCQLIG